MALRNDIVTEKGNEWVEARPWLLTTPKAVRQQAVFRCCSAYKGAFTKLRNGDVRHFEMKKQKKRSNTWTIGIERGARLQAGGLHIFPKVMTGAVRHYGKLPPLEHDMSIHKDAAGRVFLGVPVPVPVVKVEADDRPTVALDPGVRKFLTAFDTAGTAQFIGTDVRDRFWKILQHIDEVDLRMPRVAHVERRRLRKKKLLLFKQYQDLRDEFQWKVIDALTKEYSMIILPRLNTPQMVRRSEGTWRRRLRTKTVRQMVSLSHGMFFERLKGKCAERDVVFIHAHECYTSKTCSRCGKVSEVGGSEVFRCRAGCGLVADRDLNAAKNIMLANTISRELPPDLASVLSDRRPEDAFR